MLINESEKVVIKKLKSPEELIDYLQKIDDVYGNLGDCNPTKKRKVLIAFDDMTADMKPHKILSPIVTDFFEEKETQYSTCFYHNNIPLLFQRA